MKKLLLILLLFPTISFAEVKWECISDCRDSIFADPVYRSVIPLGWLVKNGRGGDERITFIPDVNHEWEVK